MSRKHHSDHWTSVCSLILVDISKASTRSITIIRRIDLENGTMLMQLTLKRTKFCIVRSKHDLFNVTFEDFQNLPPKLLEDVRTVLEISSAVINTREYCDVTH